MKPISSRSDHALAGYNAHLLQIIFSFILLTSLVCSLYASFDARGLYADGAAFLVAIYERKWFLFPSSTRVVVDILRQGPIVLMSRYTSATLFECGQVFTFVMLTLPTVLCSVCWLIVPRDQKAWSLFPLASLLIGFAATSMHAIGEAAIAASYYWILLFILLFRARSIAGQALFLLLCIPAFWLHEGAFPMTVVLLLSLALRVHSAAGHPFVRLFVGLASLLLVTILVDQIGFVINPLYPGDRANILRGLTQLEFLYFDHHFNFPCLNGIIAMLTLSAAFSVYVTQPTDKAIRYAKMIVLTWAFFAVATTACTLIIEESFSPFAQLQARYHPPIISAIFGTFIIFVLRFRLPDRLWMHPAAIFTLASLCAAQAVADINATHRWSAYVSDLQSRLTNGRGLIPWEATSQTADEQADTNWRLFKIGWVVPHTCIIFAPNGIVRAIIAPPEGTTSLPLDPDGLPELRGIDYAPYKSFLRSTLRHSARPAQFTLIPSTY
jgi:hypothetical protein